ncbi:MAG: fumarate hydratase [Thermoguttaceae bacterium]|jgi:L(+)-tartrate dehydratase alpha subunit|nr:fumarate hydratase [Thermoguttaceae bacterium]
MITFAAIEAAMYEAMRLAATRLPPDVDAALRQARAEETDPLAVEHLDMSLENFRLAAEGNGLVCGDTGYPLYFVTAGSGTQIEGGFGRLWDAARSATARLTDESFLRPTMVDPLTRENPGQNVGPGMPKLELAFSGPGDGLHIVAAPKGGGSEIFGTFYRMLFPSDGEAGILAFVLESIRAGCYAGKICPPAIVGVGIGGTADLCMRLAKEAAVLRPVGRRHPNPRVANLETKLLEATRAMGIGPMGARGVNAVIGLHIETAVTHTAALPVAVNAQCLIGRRWTASIDGQSNVSFFGEMP